MPTIRVKENEPFEVALRRFKRTIEKSGLLTELRAREFYEKPTAERKRKKAAAIKRHYKRLRSMMLPKKLYQFFKHFKTEAVMSLKDQITSDMRDAMRAHDKEKLSALRMLLSSIKQKEVDEQITADNAVIQQIIAKLIKQRKDSVEQYLAGNRKDLADKESAEIKTFEVYLPAQLSDEEIQKIVDEVVTSAGLSGSAAMGKAMGMIKPKVAGKGDMGRVSALLKARLAQ